MKRSEKKGQPTAEQIRKASEDAIAFLCSMVKLVDKRGWREVHFEFANYVLGMADKILAPDPDLEWQGKRAHLDSGGHLSEVFEDYERVPVPVFKGMMSLLERELRKDVDRAIEAFASRQRAA